MGGAPGFGPAGGLGQEHQAHVFDAVVLLRQAQSIGCGLEGVSRRVTLAFDLELAVVGEAKECLVVSAVETLPVGEDRRAAGVLDAQIGDCLV